jgi:hypothetical protein
MAKWQIGRHVPKCATCETEFKDGDRLYSLLQVSDDGLERQDLCVRCYSDEAVANAVFWWRTRHQVEEQRGLKLDLEAIEALFLALDPHRASQGTQAAEDGDEPNEAATRDATADQDEHDSEAASAVTASSMASGLPINERLLELRYLICLVLLRKRRLKVTKVARSYRGEVGEFFLVKRPRRQEELAVRVFDFDADKIAALRADLQRIFEGADPAELAAEEEPSDDLGEQDGDPVAADSTDAEGLR